MELNGLHLLLTYQCTFECDHCFVWGSPWQSGTMTLDFIRSLLKQAKDAGWVEFIYFEGGEPFLYYQTMLAGINLANDMGFKVGVVTNSYWATSVEDALLWLSPLVGKVQDLTISSDLFHFNDKMSQQSKYVTEAVKQLNLDLGVITIEQPEVQAPSSMGQIPLDTSSVMFRGRAADKLAPKSVHYPARLMVTCPHENLKDPGRVHVDPLGNLHICQGISIGNVLTSTLEDICAQYDPLNHPILGPILKGGPFELANQYHLPIAEAYADSCHLCYEARKMLRSQFPEILLPDQMYAVTS